MNSDLFPLYTIAGCNIFDQKSELKVPNIQRGLVWKAQQMELLWDSILREFPIGSMLVLKHENGQFDILDGQQRSNAIITGFNILELLNSAKEEKPKSILWIDLGFSPSEEESESRKYGIRLTNTSHPWGFDNDGGKLNAESRRNALKWAYGLDYPRRKQEWDIRQFVPQKFIGENFIPVPLSFFVNAAQGKHIESQNDVQLFWDEVSRNLDEFSLVAHSWSRDYYSRAKEFVKNNANNNEFVRTFLNLNKYKVVFNYVDNKEDVEVLFNRVNKLGTRMTDEELAYAAIKHYGASLCNCPDISNVIKEKSKGLMQEQTLAQILFRYCFSETKIHSSIDAKTIRKYSEKPESDSIKVELRRCFAPNGYLDELISKSTHILLKSPDVECELPNFLFAEIADKNPNLILLLFRLVEKYSDYIENDYPGFIQALVFYLYCFSTDNRPTSLIFEAISEQNNDFNIERIRNILRDSISREWCFPVISSFSNFKGLQESEFNNSWKLENYSDCRGYDIFSLLFPYKTSQGLFMLKYAQRKYYKEYFGDFEPSSKEYWDEINRPWDHDHIVPQNWICPGEWKNVQSAWINSMGNIADIPFEQNRGKSDDADWSYYEDVIKNEGEDRLLFFDNRTKNIDRDGFKNGLEVVTKEFMQISKERFLKISSEFLSVFKVLQLEMGLSSIQQERKNFILKLKDAYYSDYDIVYKGNGNIEYPINDIEDPYFWQRPWLSLINSDEGTWHNAVSIYCIREDNTFRIERGRRKSMDLNLTSTNNQWWENGTWNGRNVKQILSGEDLPTYVELFLFGDLIYNKTFNTEGFHLGSASYISYDKMIDGIGIHGHLYDYYHTIYALIKNKDENKPLPQDMVEKIKSFGRRTSNHGEFCIQVELYKDTYTKKNCDSFAELMSLLENK